MSFWLRIGPEAEILLVSEWWVLVTLHGKSMKYIQWFDLCSFGYFCFFHKEIKFIEMKEHWNHMCVLKNRILIIKKIKVFFPVCFKISSKYRSHFFQNSPLISNITLQLWFWYRKILFQFAPNCFSVLKKKHFLLSIDTIIFHVKWNLLSTT